MSDLLPNQSPKNLQVFRTPAGALVGDNFEPRVPCVVLVDTSGSMYGKPIQQLQDGLLALQLDLRSDPLASKRCEVAVIEFGDEVKSYDFFPANEWEPPVLEADGLTPMGSAIETALKVVDQRKAYLKFSGLQVYRPWIFLLTDGAPTDDVSFACKELTRWEKEGKASFFAIGVEGADFGTLASLSPARQPIKLKGLAFREFFLWVSQSMRMVSASRPGDRVALPPPTGWGEISV